MDVPRHNPGDQFEGTMNSVATAPVAQPQHGFNDTASVASYRTAPVGAPAPRRDMEAEVQGMQRQLQAAHAELRAFRQGDPTGRRQ